jgi:hypothetical protein
LFSIRKRLLSALPNVGPYIYDIKISGFTRSSIYIYDISRLRVKYSTVVRESTLKYASVVLFIRLYGYRMETGL